MTHAMTPSHFLADQATKIKTILLIEQQPLSDKFEQIMLTPEQYKGLAIFIQELTLRSGPNKGEQGFSTSDRYKNIYIPNIPDIYTEDDLESPLK